MTEKYENPKILTVAEVIEKLKNMPQDALCYTNYDSFYLHGIVDIGAKTEKEYGKIVLIWNED